MTDFVINRSTLLTGAALKAVVAGGYDAVLYEPTTGLSCIIGQYLQSVGVKQSALLGKPAASCLSVVLPDKAAWLLESPFYDAQVASELSETNDGPLHQVRREAKITKLFASQRINATFVGRYADATRRAKLVLKN